MTAPLKFSKMITETELAKRVKELGAEITEIARKEPVIAVCILKGSFIFFSDLVRHIEADIATEFLGTASYGNSMKSSGEVKLTLDLTNSIEGKTVILIEDIIDTGLTMDFLTKTLAARKPKRLLTCSLLFKPEALKTSFKPDYVGFKIPNDFVIGYGLDYQGFYRNLPYIARVESLQ
ncbi:MAG: hypoxanthine phosphoribosyltransferase [Bdellovibrionales bacterium]|nr:hypoxanthine phosphoribosyltransferase [Bdellovibrionales bacterium]